MSVLPIPSLPMLRGDRRAPLGLRPCGAGLALLQSSAWLAGFLLGVGLLLGLTAARGAQAEEQPPLQPQPVELQCRLGDGPWLPCRMEVQTIGENWLLRIGQQRIAFRHAGDGAVTMQKDSGPWQPVTATWRPDTSLCWDGVCARGDIPLD